MRNGSADLHVHTSYSDGFHTPKEVVALAAEAGLTHLAVTDHDTVAGLKEAAEEAAEAGVGFVPGIELSVEHEDQDFHLLGYWVDPDHAGLAGHLEKVEGLREERVRQILTALHRLGVVVEYGQVQECAVGSKTLGRPHVARAMVAGGWVSTIPEAFARYLRVGAPAYVAKLPLEPVTALGILRDAGGVPVLAHPGTYRLDGVLGLFLEGGLQGLEVEHPAHTPRQIEGFLRLAERHDLVVTGGSDFHGGDISDCGIGARRVSLQVLDELAARRD